MNDTDEGAPMTAEEIQECANWTQHLPLPLLYSLWDHLGDIPIDETDHIDVPFLGFPRGTHRENIWHWFEASNEKFICGEVMIGKREASSIVLIGEVKGGFDTVGPFDTVKDADDWSSKIEENAYISVLIPSNKFRPING
jgi:hypothetical protein